MRTLTVDVEDYHSLVSRDKLGVALSVSAHFDRQMEHLLDLLDELEFSATCFVVGKVARERPGIVRKILSRGHEVASHSYNHFRMECHTPDTFRQDLEASIQVLEDITGQRVRGFRAPAFSLREAHRWAFEIMGESGLEYDSSVRYAWPFGERSGQSLIRVAEACGIVELPGFALGWTKACVPLGGGGGLRLIPEFVTRWGVARIRQKGFLAPIYVHPYDLDTSSAEVSWPSASLWRRARFKWFDWVQQRGRGKVAPRLSRASKWNPCLSAI